VRRLRTVFGSGRNCRNKCDFCQPARPTRRKSPGYQPVTRGTHRPPRPAPLLPHRGARSLPRHSARSFQAPLPHLQAHYRTSSPATAPTTSRLPPAAPPSHLALYHAQPPDLTFSRIVCASPITPLPTQPHLRPARTSRISSLCPSGPARPHLAAAANGIQVSRQTFSHSQ